MSVREEPDEHPSRLLARKKGCASCSLTFGEELGGCWYANSYTLPYTVEPILMNYISLVPRPGTICYVHLLRIPRKVGMPEIFEYFLFLVQYSLRSTVVYPEVTRLGLQQPWRMPGF
jgi:hypothetical protein